MILTTKSVAVSSILAVFVVNGSQDSILRAFSAEEVVGFALERGLPQSQPLLKTPSLKWLQARTDGNISSVTSSRTIQLLVLTFCLSFQVSFGHEACCNFEFFRLDSLCNPV